MNTIKNILDSELIYTPWLIDLAFLSENVIKRKGIKMGFELAMPNTRFHDSVPYPQLVTNLVITISYLEKGLKYLLLAHSEQETYETLTKNRRYKHNLKNIFDDLILKMPNFLSSFKPKQKKLFFNLLETNYTNLRYLHLKESISINEKVLIEVIIVFKNILLKFREKHIYSNDSLFLAVKKNKRDQILINYSVNKFPPKIISPDSFKNIINGKSIHNVIATKNGSFEFVPDRRLKEDEKIFINSCYKLENNSYILHSGLKIRAVIKLFNLFQKIEYSFANWDYPTLHINK